MYMTDFDRIILATVVFLISNAALVYMIWRKNGASKKQHAAICVSDRKIYQLWFVSNFAGGLFVGAVIALSVLRSSEPGYFLMPLVVAPFAYWIGFSIPIILTLVLIKRMIHKK